MNPRRLYRLLGLAAALALPVVLIGANVRIAFSSQAIYTYAIDAFDAPTRTDLPREELLKGTRGLIDYFNSDEALLSITVRTHSGIEEPLFNDREAIHFRDVKALLRGVYTIQVASMALVLLAVGVAVAAIPGNRRELTRSLLRALRTSAIATIATIAALGLFAALGGFDFLFLQFHLLSFSNDLWMGTATDRMVLMFPKGFFFQATLLIGLATVLEAGLVALATTVTLRFVGRRERQASAGDSVPAADSAITRP